MNANEKKYVEKTLRSYEEKEVTKLDELRALDKKAKSGATIFAYVFGSIGSLVLGFGMCVAMKVILADLMIVGIIIGLELKGTEVKSLRLGKASLIDTYGSYEDGEIFIENLKIEEYANQIKELSNELLNK